jgi:hypothetical protein
MFEQRGDDMPTNSSAAIAAFCLRGTLVATILTLLAIAAMIAAQPAQML